MVEVGSKYLAVGNDLNELHCIHAIGYCTLLKTDVFEYLITWKDAQYNFNNN